jgi:hypothetical protein
MEQEAGSCSYGQKILHMLYNEEVHYCGHKPITGTYPKALESSSLCYILFLKVHFNTGGCFAFQPRFPK